MTHRLQLNHKHRHKLNAYQSRLSKSLYCHIREYHGDLQSEDPHDILYDIYRAACVKEFELVLEQSGKLLKKRISVYFASNRAVDKLSFKEIFRQAVMHTLLDIDTSERWLVYRDNRTNTAHDYGEEFAETTLKLLPQFIIDAKALSLAIADSQTDD